MNKLIQTLCSWPVALGAGVVAMVLLFVLIRAETSVQPYSAHPWADELITEPLAEGVSFQQEIIIPEGLDGDTFRIALFFGKKTGAGSGAAEIVLIQDSHIQKHLVTNLSPDPNSTTAIYLFGLFLRACRIAC